MSSQRKVKTYSCFKDTLKAFDELKNKQKSVWSNAFYKRKSMHILKVYSIHHILRWNTNVKKKFFWQNKRYKKITLFLSRAPTHHSFTFNLWFIYELRHKVRLSKTVRGIFYFRLRFVFIKVYIFVQQIAYTRWLQNNNSFQN